MKKILHSMPNMKDARARFSEETLRESFSISDTIKNIGKNKTYYVLTYGCQGNEADSEVISGILMNLGYTEAVSQFESDVVILNTCAIRGNAENRIWGVLGQLKGSKRDNPDMIIGVCGCMPQEEVTTNKLIKSYPYVDLIFGTHNIGHLPALLAEIYKKHARVVEVLSRQGNVLEDTPKNRLSKHKAWVNIMYGCSEFCTYCIVPYTRGKERSRAKEDIIEEVNDLVQKGYKEVTLLGQNVNAYGTDTNSDYTFGDLLVDLDKTGIERIRFTTSHPRDLDDKTINAMASCKSVMPHLHLPVQSGDNTVLKRMNRKYTHESYMEKINKLKALIPDISITTDIIVAFPGETEEQFLRTIDLVREVEYEGAYTFIYSKRDGTPAAKMEQTLTEEEAHDRLDRLNAVVNEFYLKGTKRFLGRVVPVLVDGPSKNGDNMMCGYSPNLKLVHFPSTDKGLVGKTVNVKITTAMTWFMLGEMCD